MPITLDKKTSVPPFICEGVRFDCYQTGINRTVWATSDGRMWCSRNRFTGTGSTYSAYVETGADYPDCIGKRFQSSKGACKALVKKFIAENRRVSDPR